MEITGKAVVVTGASSGIGAATARRLADAGFTVFAGVRSPIGTALGSPSPNILPLRLDVTDADSIASAARAVAELGPALFGLINNAGIAVAGPLEYLPIQELRAQLEINVTGVVAVTQAFLPLLRRTHGRIINVGSIQGRLTAPFLGPYSASKMALEAITDALRMELAPSGIAVSIIEPGAVATPIWQKGAAQKTRLLDAMPPEALTHYGKSIDAVTAIAQSEERSGIPPERVAELLLRILTAKKPRARYLVGRPARIQAVIAHLPESIRDRLLRRAMRLP
jgi:NAD(P)-dependent dehydrogenase (short-subunit alcohol dehydrogenase family)